MKKFRYILLCLTVLLLGLAIQGTAATVQDVAGTYDVTSQIKLNVKGLGKDVSIDSDLLILNPDGTFMLGDAEGTFSLDPTGKKILLVIDGDSLDNLESVFVQGIIELAQEKDGTSLAPGDITCEIHEIKVSKIKIDKKTNKPKGNFKVKIKGIATTIVPGEEVKQRKVSFQGKFGIKKTVIEDTETPVTGEWNGPADFGEIGFSVDNTGTGITEHTPNFIDFSCGGVVRNGAIKTTKTPPWPIADSQFTIDFSMMPFEPFEMTISGTFDETGTQASGTWEAVSSGTSCSGSWNASPGGTTTAIDWIFTSLLIERQDSTWIFYQRFAVTGASGNVQITSTLKEAAGGFAKLDDLTEQFYVEEGKEYEIAVSVDILGWGRCGSFDNDVIIFSSPGALSEEDTLISPTYDPSLEPPGYKCITQYSINDISVGLVQE